MDREKHIAATELWDKVTQQQSHVDYITKAVDALEEREEAVMYTLVEVVYFNHKRASIQVPQETIEGIIETALATEKKELSRLTELYEAL